MVKRFGSRTTALRLTAVLAVASAAAAGCERKDDWQGSSNATRVCVDYQGHRVPDDQCAAPRPAGGVSPFLWYYLGTQAARQGYGVPAVGGFVAGGGYTPQAGTAYTAAPATGISRGGFGGTARSFGGLGGGGGE